LDTARGALASFSLCAAGSLIGRRATGASLVLDDEAVFSPWVPLRHGFVDPAHPLGGQPPPVEAERGIPCRAAISASAKASILATLAFCRVAITAAFSQAVNRRLNGLHGNPLVGGCFCGQHGPVCSLPSVGVLCHPVSLQIRPRPPFACHEQVAALLVGRRLARQLEGAFLDGDIGLL
jgi:hypothetical protein